MATYQLSITYWHIIWYVAGILPSYIVCRAIAKALTGDTTTLAVKILVWFLAFCSWFTWLVWFIVLLLTQLKIIDPDKESKW